MNWTRQDTWPTRQLWLLLLVVVLWPAGVGHAQSARNVRLSLLTTGEAKQLRLTDQEWKQVHRARSAGSSAGPRIVIQSPQPKDTSQGEVIETATPANLAVIFQENRSPVDMNSLEVTARKGFFSKSLTDLLKPFVRGTTLDVKDVAIPEGKFLIEIAITDRGGAKTMETYRLQVQAR